MTKRSDYEVVIGLEVHAQLSTHTKIFCGCSTAFGAEPNSQTCPVCLGMPGVLPVLNKEVVEYAIRMGLATNCEIRRHNTFARKNYFYPDLPKGYQISQFEEPICENGFVEIDSNGRKKKITLIRIHMEEDAGKSVHAEDYVAENESLIDLNRCGVPLIEIVSAPDIRSPREAVNYLVKLRQLVRYLGISDGNMEEGSFRCDANISLRPLGQKSYGTRTELKNMNSFSNVERALQVEIERQTGLLNKGLPVEQETLLWDADRGQVRSMRGKEESHDYRYFPEPDLVPLVVSETWLEQIRENMPELPARKAARFKEQFSLPDYDIDILTGSREMADYFEKVVQHCANYKLASNWMMGEVARYINEHKIGVASFPVKPEKLAALLNAIEKKTVSGSAAKKIFERMLTSDEPVDRLIEKMGLRQVSDNSLIEEIVDKVLQEHPDEVASYKNGKTQLLGFFVGQVMRASGRKANPQIVNEILNRKLK